MSEFCKKQNKTKQNINELLKAYYDNVRVNKNLLSWIINQHNLLDMMLHVELLSWKHIPQCQHGLCLTSQYFTL